MRLWDLRSQSFEPIQVLDHAKDSVTSVRIGQYSILVGYRGRMRSRFAGRRPRASRLPAWRTRACAGRSVDGCVRDYDIRMGLLRTDKIGGTPRHAAISQRPRGLTHPCPFM